MCCQVSLPWFWEHFDAEKYSIWLGKYNHDDDLSNTPFMNVNLMGGKIFTYQSTRVGEIATRIDAFFTRMLCVVGGISEAVTR